MKNVLITGGSGGIGSAIAESFAQEGYNVIIHSHHNKPKANMIARRLCTDYQITSLAVQADISDRSSVNNMYDIIDTMFGSVDILINNAGIAQQKLFTDITAEDWKNMFGVNLDGVFNCTQEVLRRYMLKRHNGVILNISSMWGQVGASCEVHYSASKAGVIGLTKALAKEVGLSGIRVNCICPGVVMTDMMKSFDKQTIQELKEESPLNMLGTGQDIGEAAVFLCSERAKFITGQVLGVNGGFVI
jgi:3-oxoacyl-[acyl-carrier protein] reductase